MNLESVDEFDDVNVVHGDGVNEDVNVGADIDVDYDEDDRSQTIDIEPSPRKDEPSNTLKNRSHMF